MTPQKPRRRHAAPGPTRWTDPARPSLRGRFLAALGRLLCIRREHAEAGAVEAMCDRVELAATERRAALQQGLAATRAVKARTSDRIVVRSDSDMAAEIDRQLAAWDTDAAIRKVCRGC